MSLFDKKSKVLAGKDSEQKPSQKKSLFASLRAKWNKLNSMEQRQAYTYGAIGLAVLILLFVFGAVMSSSAGKEDFSDFETRGYDLAAMPFSTDEAEQYLLAAKYPDMQGQITDGLYSPEEKEERQQEDAEQALEDFEVGADAASQAAAGYIGGGRSYGGGGGGGSRGRTQVGQLGSASLKSGGGSGMSSTFGPTGDFSNFKNQNKGNEINNIPQNRGTGDARKALFQTAMASRAARADKNGGELGAKKALMGGAVAGSDKFSGEGQPIGLGGLGLDTNSPNTSADLSGLEDKLKNAAEKAEKEQNQQEQYKWWQQLLINFASGLGNAIGTGLSGLVDNAFRGEYRKSNTGTTTTTNNSQFSGSSGNSSNSLAQNFDHAASAALRNNAATNK